MKNVKLLALCIVLCTVSIIDAQFIANYIHPNPFKFSMQDFNRVNVMCLGDEERADVKYELYSEKNELICEVRFNSILLNRGPNSLNFSNGKIKWGSSYESELLMNDNLKKGNYQLCVEVRDKKEVLPAFDDCFEVELNTEEIENVLNETPIELSYPENKEEIEELRPQLIWLPPTPTYQGTQYYLLLVEKGENLSCTESLNNKIPIVEDKNVIGNIYNYPPESLSLEKGKKYCWRVSAHQNQKEYTRSEDWMFELKGEEKKAESIPLINDMSGLTIVVKESLRFSLNNFSNAKSLKIKIGEVLEEIPIKYGMNVIDIPIEKLEDNIKTSVECLNVNSNKFHFYVIKK